MAKSSVPKFSGVAMRAAPSNWPDTPGWEIQIAGFKVNAWPTVGGWRAKCVFRGCAISTVNRDTSSPQKALLLLRNELRRVAKALISLVGRPA